MSDNLALVPTPDGEPAAVVSSDAWEDPFTAALRAAIATRGVSLESLRLALQERGSRVSVATLSYWRSGRSRPDRGGSMVALAHLEEVLRLPAGFLVSKVTPRGPGSLVAGELPSHYTSLQAPPNVPGSPTDDDVIDACLGLLGMTLDGGLTRVSYHDRLEIREDHTDAAHEVRTVLRAKRPGIERYPVWYTHDDSAAFPFVSALSNCTLGRCVEFREKTAVAAEMLLDHALEEGESIIVEHRMESIGQTEPMRKMLRLIGDSIREVVVEVRFAPGQTPARATLHTVRGGQQLEQPATPVGSSLHLLVIDPEPGVYGLEWEW